jgi:hypothetical protein
MVVFMALTAIMIMSIETFDNAARQQYGCQEKYRQFYPS